MRNFKELKYISKVVLQRKKKEKLITATTELIVAFDDV